uniref:NADHubiquinone oxidoreductase putative n=1 Tax=Albugo laibachii Nc14 TaxID=890382 RepID=F0WZ62_9STRA|nr:NADHubiquinone oxidoreductase putative [Albugo laibachii Nc14]|eukprot:CCA26778.1 NADHubiquinone oxidoreductase putative [Albugo laibachii Nc14]
MNAIIFRRMSLRASRMEQWRAISTGITCAVRDETVNDHSSNYKLVIIGSGWAGYKFFHECRKYRGEIEKSVNNAVDVVVISKRNHFLYTPLLASTTVGTLEFRSIVEPIRDNHLRHEEDFLVANVRSIDPVEKQVAVHCELNDRTYNVRYDALVIACGAQPVTFGLPGVERHAFFLKELHHARAIRTRILENFELSTQAGISEEEKRRLLHFVVVGGGPTGVEFCGELHDFLVQDLARLYPLASKYVFISLVDSGEILTGFDQHLREFALRKLASRATLRLVKDNCEEVLEDGVILQSGTRVPCGLVVWTAGVGPNELTKSLDICEKSTRGTILTNEYCQVLGVPQVEKESIFGLDMKSNIFSIGDCAEISGSPLPATAQKAQTQAIYLSQLLRQSLPRGKDAHIDPYHFQSRGMMAYLGSYEGLFELKSRNRPDGVLARASGWKAWLIWRSAYLTQLGSWRLRMQVPLDWLKAMIVGRDVSRF